MLGFVLKQSNSEGLSVRQFVWNNSKKFVTRNKQNCCNIYMFCDKLHIWLLTQSSLTTLHIGHQTEWWLPPQSVSEDWHLVSMSVIGPTVVLLLVFFFSHRF